MNRKQLKDLDDPNLLLDDDYIVETSSIGVTDFSHEYQIPKEVKLSLNLSYDTFIC